MPDQSELNEASTAKPAAGGTPSASEAREGIANTREFWNVEPCGTQFVPEYADRSDFFAKYREFRYQTEWHIPRCAQFDQARGKRVLEIGCGNGVDGVEFARHGADYTGVDLTPAAVEATRSHFEILGLRGQFQVENAQKLSFPDGHFDIVYSWGVLHHTPDPAAAMREVHRVLKPGGRAILMLYHRHSFNYYVRIMLAMRLRLLATILWRSLFRKSSGATQLVGVGSSRRVGNHDADLWDVHYQSFLRKGWSYLRADRFVHHCTDGPECPYAYVYSSREAKALLSAFAQVRTTVVHFPLQKYAIGRCVPRAIEAMLARTMGWNLVIYADKAPASGAPASR